MAEFAEVDALIARAEAEAAALPPEPPVPPEALTEQERQEVAAALALVYGTERFGDQPGQAT